MKKYGKCLIIIPFIMVFGLHANDLVRVIIAATNPFINVQQQDPGIGGIQSFDYHWMQFVPLINEQLAGTVLQRDVEIINIYRADTKIIQDASKAYLGVVHEVSLKTLPLIKNCDFIIYMNWLQRDIVEKVAGVNKPHIVLPRLPMPKHILNDIHLKDVASRDNAMYVGGHLSSDKRGNFVGKLEEVIQKLDQNPASAGVRIRCYFVCRTDACRKDLGAIARKLNRSLLLRDRVDCVVDATHFSYVQMLEHMADCRYAFMWRDGPTLPRIKQYLAKLKKSALWYPIGESSMLAAAEVLGCVIVTEQEERCRFLSLYEPVPPFTFEDYARVLVEAIVLAGKL